MCKQLRKCAAGDIVPSLTRLKKHGSESKFFISIFRKFDQINIQNRGKWQPSKIVKFFLTYISHTCGTIKPPCWAAMKSNCKYKFVSFSQFLRYVQRQKLVFLFSWIFQFAVIFTIKSLYILNQHCICYKFLLKPA